MNDEETVAKLRAIAKEVAREQMAADVKEPGLGTTDFARESQGGALSQAYKRRVDDINNSLRELHLDQSFQQSKILIAYPCNFDVVPIVFHDSMMVMIKPPSFGYLRVSNSTGVAEMRNEMVHMLLTQEFTHLFMVDIDMWYPRTTLKALFLRDVDVVAGLACGRKPVNSETNDPPQFRQTFGIWNEEHTGFDYPVVMPHEPGLYACDVISGGGVLIKREVFDKMSPPYFEQGTWRQRDDGRWERRSEDINFYIRAKEAGFEVYCDTSLRYGHLLNVAAIPQIDPESGAYSTFTRIV